jgi:sulfur carrier protein
MLHIFVHPHGIDVVVITLHAMRHPGWHGPLVLIVVACAPTMSDASIAIVVNGEDRQVPAGTTVLALIESLGLGGRKVAVERNREVVPRASHGTCVLADGDRLELVTFVGGG